MCMSHNVRVTQCACHAMPLSPISGEMLLEDLKKAAKETTCVMDCLEIIIVIFVLLDGKSLAQDVLRCKDCVVTFNSHTQLEQHLTSPKHFNKVQKKQTAPVQFTGQGRGRAQGRGQTASMPFRGQGRGQARGRGQTTSVPFTGRGRGQTGSAQFRGQGRGQARGLGRARGGK